MKNKLNSIFILNLILNDLLLKIISLHWKIKYFLTVWCNKFLNYLNFKIFFKKVFFYWMSQNHFFKYFQYYNYSKMIVLKKELLEQNYNVQYNYFTFKFLN